ncbi:hypothetical protein PQZ09_03070 [Methylophilaceae bacterium]|jgi:hypothetical protein|nr:hypothetical protein [Methylophilaceae bacterium]
MIKKYFLFTLLLMSVSIAKGESFKDFTLNNYFAPIDEKYLQLTAVCRKNFDEKDKKKYFEILFYNQGKNIFDMNKHYKIYQEGYKNLKPPIYSFTVRNWFKTIAIQSGKSEFITTTEQSSIRRNEVIPSKLAESVLNSGQLDMYFHYQNDNTKSMGKFKVSNNKVLIDCFD